MKHKPMTPFQAAHLARHLYQGKIDRHHALRILSFMQEMTGRGIEAVASAAIRIMPELFPQPAPIKVQQEVRR